MNQHRVCELLGNKLPSSSLLDIPPKHKPKPLETLELVDGVTGSKEILQRLYKKETVPIQEPAAKEDVLSKVKDNNSISQSELSPVTEEIYQQLIYPSWKTIRGLDRYIKIIGRRVKQLMEQGKTEYYVLIRF